MNRRRGQSAAESLIALALFAIAGFGAWAMYGPQIRRTAADVLIFFGLKDAPDPGPRLPG